MVPDPRAGPYCPDLRFTSGTTVSFTPCTSVPSGPGPRSYGSSVGTVLPRLSEVESLGDPPLLFGTPVYGFPVNCKRYPPLESQDQGSGPSPHPPRGSLVVRPDGRSTGRSPGLLVYSELDQNSELGGGEGLCGSLRSKGSDRR